MPWKTGRVLPYSPGGLSDCYLNKDLVFGLFTTVLPAFGSWKNPKPNGCDPQTHPTESIILTPFWFEFYQVIESCDAVMRVVRENVKTGLKLHLNL